MQRVELLQEALDVARRLGYQIREEYMGGAGGGACEFGGRKWLFLDLALTADEQFEQVVAMLREDPALFSLGEEVSPQLAWYFGWGRAAA